MAYDVIRNSDTIFIPMNVKLKAEKRGFTVIELVVVAAIMTIISAIILANNNKYSANVVLQNLAYDIALSVRQAQVYGISVYSDSPGVFNVGHGVHFSMAAPTLYYIFTDTNGNGKYDTGEAAKTFTMKNGFRLQKLCWTATAGGAETCSALSTTQLDILYIRPEPDAWINPILNGVASLVCSVPVGGNQICTLNKFGSRVVVLSPKGDTKSIISTQNGQISVQTP